jgi:hypothetical protein
MARAAGSAALFSAVTIPAKPAIERLDVSRETSLPAKRTHAGINPPTPTLPLYLAVAAFLTNLSSHVLAGSTVAAAISLSNCLRKSSERFWLSALTMPSRE